MQFFQFLFISNSLAISQQFYLLNFQWVLQYDLKYTHFKTLAIYLKILTFFIKINSGLDFPTFIPTFYLGFPLPLWVYCIIILNILSLDNVLIFFRNNSNIQCQAFLVLEIASPIKYWNGKLFNHYLERNRKFSGKDMVKCFEEDEYAFVCVCPIGNNVFFPHKDFNKEFVARLN